MIKVYGVILFGVCYVVLWVNVFRGLYKHMRIRNNIAMFIASHLNVPIKYAYSVFATVYYCTMPIVGSILLGRIAGFNIMPMFQVSTDIVWYVALILSIIGAMTLSSMGISIMYVIQPRIDVPGEISRIRWMQGIYNCPKKIAWVLPMVSATVEELFFRGALLTALMSSQTLSFTGALIIVTLLFLYGQVILTETKIQAVVLTIASIVISVVGGLLFVYCKSIIPPIVMHASFAGFYSNYKSRH